MDLPVSIDHSMSGEVLLAADSLRRFAQLCACASQSSQADAGPCNPHVSTSLPGALLYQLPLSAFYRALSCLSSGQAV